MTYRSSTIYTRCRNTFNYQLEPSEHAYKCRWHHRHTMIDLAPLPRAGAFGHARVGRRALRLRILPIARPILFHDIGASIQKTSIDGAGALVLLGRVSGFAPLWRVLLCWKRLNDWLAPLRGKVHCAGIGRLPTGNAKSRRLGTGSHL